MIESSKELAEVRESVARAGEAHEAALVAGAPEQKPREARCAEATGSAFRFEGMYAPEAMVKAAVIRARPRCYGTAPRWVAVRDAIGYGSTTSTALCRHFGLDPHEEIEGWPQPDADEQNTELRNAHSKT